MWRSRRDVRRTIASLPAKCRQLAKVLPSADGTIVTDLDREFEGIEVIAWRRYVVLPTHPARSAWDWALILLVIYTALSVPLEICFKYDQSVGFQVIDWLVDIFFLFDLILNFRTAYYNYDGTFEIDPLMIRNRYVRSWFVIDLVASIPIERLSGGGGQTSAVALAKMPRLLRLSRLLKKLDKFTSARAMRVVSVLIFFLMFTHFVGCFWWLVGVSQEEKGWQFQPDVVPLLLQDVDWESTDEWSVRLAAAPLHGVEPGTPDWLPELYNYSALLGIYETKVGVGKSYITSMYWALTMVMKSPWLPPQSTGEQAYCSMVIVFGAIVFAAFLGHVTTMIQSYEKSNALYRDGMTSMHHFFESRPISRTTQRSILAYTDAYFKAHVEGIPEKEILQALPAHLRDPVLMEVYRPVLEACHFLQDCSYSGCGAFLSRIDPEVCLKGDCLLRAGTTSDYMYILMTGELQVSYPPEGNRLRKITNLLGSSRILAKNEGEHKQSTRVPQGRVERRGSLVGWQPPYGPMLAFKYTARAYRFTQLFSIRRAAMREVLEAHTVDAPIWLKAVEHANKMLTPSKGASSKSARSDRSEPSKRAGETADDQFRRVSESASPAPTADEAAQAAAARGGFLPPSYVQPQPPPPRQLAPAQPSTIDEVDDEFVSSAPAYHAGGKPDSAERASAAWMAQREQAEAALKSELAAVREEVRAGFAAMASAVAELKALRAEP